MPINESNGRKGKQLAFIRLGIYTDGATLGEEVGRWSERATLAAWVSQTKTTSDLVRGKRDVRENGVSEEGQSNSISCHIDDCSVSKLDRKFGKWFEEEPSRRELVLNDKQAEIWARIFLLRACLRLTDSFKKLQREFNFFLLFLTRNIYIRVLEINYHKIACGRQPCRVASQKKFPSYDQEHQETGHVSHLRLPRAIALDHRGKMSSREVEKENCCDNGNAWIEPVFGISIFLTVPKMFLLFYGTWFEGEME